MRHAALRRSCALAALALLPACGALLDLPDPNVDPNYGQNTDDSGLLVDGAYADGFVPPSDGSVTDKDGSTGGDGSTTLDAASACGTHPSCFGGTCMGGVCAPVAVATTNNPSVIAADDTYVYVISGTQLIERIDPNNGAASTLAPSESELADLKVIGNRIYFSNTGFGNPNKGTVTSCPTAGCGTVRIDYVAGSSVPLFGVTADTTNVYFTNGSGSGGVYRCPLGTANCSPAAVDTATSANAYALLLSGGTLFWDDNSGQANGIFQSAAPSGTKFSGGDATGVVDIAVNSAAVFLTTGSTIDKRVLAGNAKSQIVSGRINDVAIAVDENYVYWLEATNTRTAGMLERCPLAFDCTVATDKIETMAHSLDGPADLVVTNDSVYFTTADDGTIWRVAK